MSNEYIQEVLSINHLESLIRLIKLGLLEDREIPSKQEINSDIHALELLEI